MIDAEVDIFGLKKATVLLTMNAIFGSIFFLSLVVTIVMMIRRKIDDLFLRYAMYAMVLALALSICMCFIITSYNAELYMDEQTVAWQ